MATATSPSSPTTAITSETTGNLHTFLRHRLKSHCTVLQSHAYLLRRHILLSDPVPSSLLLSSAAYLSPLRYTLALLGHLPPPVPLFSVNAVLRQVSLRSPLCHLFSFFSSLVSSGFYPNRFSLPPLLAAAGKCGTAAGDQLHAQAVRRGLVAAVHVGNSLLYFYAARRCLVDACKMFAEMPTKDIVSYNSMMDAFLSSGNAVDARKLFDGMPLRNVVSWNVMITGYVKLRRPELALEMVRQMVRVPVRCSETTMVGVVTACARLGRLNSGKEVHGFFVRRFVEDNIVFWTALIDMYGKCRSTDMARRVFDRVREKNLVCWNAMIVGHCLYGEPEDGLKLFHDMIGREDVSIESQNDSRILPDEVTFVGVLCACARASLLAKGKRYFEQMTTVYNLKRTFAHYWCLANLYGNLDLW